MSDYTLKGERKATLKINPDTDYVIQVIAREDKGDVGIDYKYSDMVTSSPDGQSSPRTTTTTTTTPATTSTRASYLRPQTKSLLGPSVSDTSFAEPLQYETTSYDETVGLSLSLNYHLSFQFVVSF